MLLTRFALLLMLLAAAGCGSGGNGGAFADQQGRAAIRSAQYNAAAAPRALQPTYREQRQARAMVDALDENKKALGLVGADFMLRNDGTASKAHQVQFVASPGALTLDITASPLLNLFDNAPHALRLVVYHLSDAAALEQLAATNDGMIKLLQGERFDESVRGIRVLEIQPGQECRVRIDRAENGRYVGLAAGYHQLERGCNVTAVSYPVSQFVQQTNNLLTKRKTAMFSPQPLHLRIRLDQSSMSVMHSDAEALHVAETSANPRDYLFTR